MSKEPVPAARVDALSSLVDPFAIGLGAARSLDRERIRHAQLDRLRSSALAIAEATTLKAALQTIGDEARAPVNARYAARDRPGRRHAGAVHSVGSERVGTPGRVCSSAKPAWIHDVVDDPRFLRLALAAREGLHGAFFVPVTTEGAFLGVMENHESRKSTAGRRAAPDDRCVGAQIGQLIARRRAEDEREKLPSGLKRSWLRGVVERSPVGIVLALGAHGDRIVANRRASELLGIDFAPEGGLAQLSGRLTGVEGRALADSDIPVRRALETDELVSGAELLWRSAVGERGLLVNASPIDDAVGHRIGAAMVIEDISSLRELQKLRDEWTSMVAHDLRQPVNAIALSAQLIARGGAQSEVQELADRILSGSRRLDRMIEDLLDASQIDARRLKLVKEETDVEGLLRAGVLSASSATAGHAVTFEIRGVVPKLMVDPARIEQVVFNLLANAGK